MSVLNAQNAVGELRNFLIVCNHDYGLEKFFAGNFEQSQHILACSRIEISGRLIREQKGWLCRKHNVFPDI